MTEVILDQSQIAPLVGESEPARVAQHVRMDMGEVCSHLGRLPPSLEAMS